MKILFHHIPKTAGTSLVAQARWYFGGDHVHAGRYDGQVDEAAILDPRFSFYHGHFTRRFVLNFRRLVPDALIFTFLRHPFNRTLSQFHNWTDPLRVRRELDVIEAASGPSETLRRLREKFEGTIFAMSLEEFLRSDDPDIVQATDNVQSRLMSASDAEMPHLRLGNSAVDAIGFYDFIGVQEHYGACLRILEKRCGLPVGCLGGARRDNASDYAREGDRYRVTAAEMHWLERRNAYDLALFTTCYALLLKQYGDWLPEDAADLLRHIDPPAVVGSRESRPAMPASTLLRVVGGREDPR